MILLHLTAVSLLDLCFHRSTILWTKLTVPQPESSRLSAQELSYTAGSLTPNPVPAPAETILWTLAWNVGKQSPLLAIWKLPWAPCPSQRTRTEYSPLMQTFPQLSRGATCSTAYGCWRRPQGMDIDVQKCCTPHHIRDIGSCGANGSNVYVLNSSSCALYQPDIPSLCTCAFIWKPLFILFTFFLHRQWFVYTLSN